MRYAAKPTGKLGGLVTMRLIVLFGLMRRSGVLAQRRLFDQSETEWRIMTQVGQSAPLSLNGLSELVLQDRGQLSRAVKSMVARGLLSRERKPGGPEIEIDLTAAGRKIYAAMVERAIERDRTLTEGIPDEDIEVLWRVVERMIERADAVLGAERELD